MNYSVSNVVEKNIEWDHLYPDTKSEIYDTCSQIINGDEREENAFENANKTMLDIFINKLFSCKPSVYLCMDLKSKESLSVQLPTIAKFINSLPQPSLSSA